MTGVLEILQAVLATLIAVPAVVFLIENLACFLVGKEPAAGDHADRPRLAVLIPAHNEEAGIAGTIASVKAQLHEGDRLVVIADNCTDKTAMHAREAGATVAERTDTSRRGKGFALAFGLRSLEEDPPQVAIFVDADCRLSDGCLDALSRQAERAGLPAQAVYVMDPPPGAGVRDRVSAFAVRVKNESRPAGLNALGGGCLITGSGFALPWFLAEPQLFERGDIVEDMSIGLDLAIGGYEPRVCRGARVTSELPATAGAKRSQRVRWEHGHLAALIRYGVPAIARGLMALRFGLVLLGLELLVPPLSLLVMLATVLAVAAWAGVALSVPYLSVWPALILTGALGMIAIGTIAAWYRVGRDVLPARELPAAVWYAISKGPIYVGAIFKRQTKWVRTARDGES